MITVKRGKLYYFNNKEEAIEFLEVAMRQFDIVLTDECFNKFIKCKALAVSNYGNYINYRTTVPNEYRYQTIAWKQLKEHKGETTMNEQITHPLIDKYVKEKLHMLERGYDEEISELFKVDKLLVEFNKLMNKYGFAEQESLPVLMPNDETKKKINDIDKKYDKLKAEVRNKAFEANALIQTAKSDPELVISILNDYGYVQYGNKEE